MYSASPIVTADITDANVTYAKMQNMTGHTVLGRQVASTGVPVEIPATVDGTVLIHKDAILGFSQTITESYTDASVTYAKVQNAAGLSVPGRSANSAGVMANITAAADGDVLRRSGTTLGFGSLAHVALPSLPICQGRLSLSSTLPLAIADISSGSTIYFHPFGGNLVSLYNGSKWVVYVMSAAVSLALGTMTASLPYDIYLYVSSGTLTLEKVAWTSGGAGTSARTSTVPSLLDGVYIKSTDNTRLYVGTIYSSSTTTTADTTLKRFVWSYYGRRWRYMAFFDSTSHSYTTSTWRQWNNTAANKFEFVVGQKEDPVSLALSGDTYGGIGYCAMGLNTLTGGPPSARNANASLVEGGAPRWWDPAAYGVGYNWAAAVEYGVTGFNLGQVFMTGAING